MAPKSNQLLMNSKTLLDIGSTIVNDAKQLAASLQSLWQQPEAALDDEGRNDNNLPACLQQDFKHYEQLQKLELDNILGKWQRIGEELSKAASLNDFQNQLGQQQFSCINIYSANNDQSNGSEITPEHLRAPNSSKPSESA